MGTSRFPKSMTHICPLLLTQHIATYLCFMFISFLSANLASPDRTLEIAFIYRSNAPHAKYSLISCYCNLHTLTLFLGSGNDWNLIRKCERGCGSIPPWEMSSISPPLPHHSLLPLQVDFLTASDSCHDRHWMVIYRAPLMYIVLLSFGWLTPNLPNLSIQCCSACLTEISGYSGTEYELVIGLSTYIINSLGHSPSHYLACQRTLYSVTRWFPLPLHLYLSR